MKDAPGRSILTVKYPELIDFADAKDFKNEDLAIEEDVVDRVLHCLDEFPTIPEYASLLKLEALECLSIGDMLRAFNLLSNAHGVRFRQDFVCVRKEKIWRQNRDNAKVESSENTRVAEQNMKFCENFDQEFDIYREVQKVIPKHWAVLQISRHGIYPSDPTDTPRLILSRVTSGDPPLVTEVQVTPTEMAELPVLKFHQEVVELNDQVSTFCKKNDTDGDSAEIRQQRKDKRREYVEHRVNVDHKLSQMLKFMESAWIRRWMVVCYFLGILADDKPEYKQKRKAVITQQLKTAANEVTDPVIMQRLLRPSHSQVDLLDKLICNRHSLHSQSEFLDGVTEILDLFDELKLATTITTRLRRLPSRDHASFPLPPSSVSTSKQNKGDRPPAGGRQKTSKLVRGPVILVLDTSIHQLPWEALPMVKNQCFTRIPCIHYMLDRLSLHSTPTVSPDNVYFLANPDGTLPDVETRMMPYFNAHPNWSGVKRVIPTEEEFSKILSERDIFIYCGHGSGCNYFPIQSILKCDVRAVGLLFGCSSSALDQQGVISDPSGVSFAYLAAGSPAVVGMLTSVTDRETDDITMALLKSWLDEGSKDLWNAVLKAKSAPQFQITKASFVMYGLPLVSREGKATVDEIAMFAIPTSIRMKV